MENQGVAVTLTCLGVTPVCTGFILEETRWLWYTWWAGRKQWEKESQWGYHNQGIQARRLMWKREDQREELRGTPRDWQMKKGDHQGLANQESLRGRIENSVKEAVGIRTTICLETGKSRLDRECHARSEAFWIWIGDSHWTIVGRKIWEKSLRRVQVT